MSHPPPESSQSKGAAVTAEGAAYVSAPQRLQYIEVATPEPGKSVQLTPAVRWCRIPLPIDLNHINVWLLTTQDGCVLVDTGMAADVCKQAWETLEREVLAQQPLRGIFITHIHPDHIGLASWLQERHRVPVWMSQRTHDQAQLLLSGQHAFDPAEAEQFFRTHGVTDMSTLQPVLSPGRFARMTSGAPQVERLVADADIIAWGGNEWTALETNGHAYGHLCLADRANNALISGDQVLPSISSNVGFTWRNRDLNPLDSFMSSLRRLRQLPESTLVLPSHGVPFRGLQQRIDDLLRHHEEQLDKLVAACATPRSAVDVLPVMFRRQLSGMHMFLAMAEALAHLEYLGHAGRLERHNDAGVMRYAA